MPRIFILAFMPGSASNRLFWRQLLRNWIMRKGLIAVGLSAAVLAMTSSAASAAGIVTVVIIIAGPVRFWDWWAA